MPTHKFEMTLLTVSKEIAIRRIKSYCASLGGTAQVFMSASDFALQSSHSVFPKEARIVVYDAAMGLKPQVLQQIREHSTLFVVDTQHKIQAIDRCYMQTWDQDNFACCSLDTLFSSQIIRVALSQQIIGNKNFSINHLLRWGHSTKVWDLNSGGSIGDKSQIFLKSLKFNGEARRLIEVASHFFQTFPRDQVLSITSLSFAADGIVAGVMARCRVSRQDFAEEIVQELSMCEFPATIINILGPSSTQNTQQNPANHDQFHQQNAIDLEIGAMVYNHQKQTLGANQAFLLKLRPAQNSTQNAFQPFKKVG